MSRVPRQLKAGIVAVLALSGSGAGLYYLDQAATERARDAYVQAVASDTSTSPAVKVAMVMAETVQDAPTYRDAECVASKAVCFS